MPPSEPITKPGIDWRGWIVLAWALWFGILYTKMVVETRGHRVRNMIPTAVRQ